VTSAERVSMRPRYTPYFVPALLAALLFLNYLYLVNLSEKDSRKKEGEIAVSYPELEGEYFATLGLSPQKPIHFETAGPARSERILSFLLNQRSKIKGNLQRLASSKEMSAFLATIKQEELLFLAGLVLDSSMDKDSRRIGLYVLTFSLPQSMLGLVEIASMPLSKELDKTEEAFEFSLRLAALLALDALPREPIMKEAFQRVFTQTNHPDLKNLALAAIASWETKGPQRLEVLAKKLTWLNLYSERRL